VVLANPISEGADQRSDKFHTVLVAITGMVIEALLGLYGGLSSTQVIGSLIRRVSDNFSRTRVPAATLSLLPAGR
jgi:hypothetical protein